MENNSNSQIDWDLLVESIQEEKCILLIGPEIFTEQGKSLQSNYLDQLAKSEKDKIHAYYPNDGFFLFKEEMYKGFFTQKLRNFYKQNFSDALYSQIANIPFHLVISLNSDNQLYNMFLKSGIQCDFEYFSKNRVAELKPPAKSKPLVYNILGSINDEESLILSHDDLFEYMQAIFGNNTVPLELKKAFKSANELIFLGFQFDKWYVQLILRLFELHKKKYSFYRFASGAKDEETKSLCINQFKIEFIDNNIQQFIESIFSHCQKKGLLRNQKQEQNKISDLAYQYIKDDNLSKTLEIMEAFFKDRDPDTCNMVIGNAGRLKRVKNELNTEQITHEEASRRTSQIRQALIELIDDIKRLEK